MNPEHKGAIAWFVDNPVAANLIMIFFLVAGFLAYQTTPKELLPSKDSRSISVTMSYDLASPKEVQENIVEKIEESLLDVEGIKEIHSVASLGSARVSVDVEDGYNVRQVLEDVKSAVESISSFPKDADHLRVNYSRGSRLALNVQLYGDLNEQTAKDLANEMKREMLATKNIKKISIWGDRPYEISIDIPKNQLLKYNITLEQVANRVRAESVSSPSGGIRAKNGNILVTVDNQAYNKQQFENIVLFTAQDGTMVRVKDIGTVKDGFVDWDAHAYFDGRYSVGLAISATNDQDILLVSKAVHQYVEAKKKDLPEGVQLAIWGDTSYYLGDRLGTMATNFLESAVLVLISLMLFMPIKTVMWVMLGLPVCFAGTFMMLPFADISINLVSLFGFILVLGILVDDGIVISESVDEAVKLNGASKDSVVAGAERVAIPAMFGGLTNMVVFLPLFFVSGPQSHWLFQVAYVYCVCMAVSIFESKFILPAHIHATGKPLLWGPFKYQHRMQEVVSIKLKDWLNTRYAPFLNYCVNYRYLTLAVFISIFILSIALVKSDIIHYELHPPEASDFLTVSLHMAEGTTEAKTQEVMERMRKSLDEVDEQYKQHHAGESLIQHVFRYNAGDTTGFFFVELTKEENRELTSFQIADAWRAQTGEIQGADIVDFSSLGAAISRSIAFVLVSENQDALEAAANELAAEMHSIKGVTNINSSVDGNRQEYIMHLKPLASSLGLTLAGVAIQVKDAFYGVEAERVQRNHQEIKVMVRYPEHGRASVEDLKNMPIRLSNNKTVPLREVVDLEFVMSPTRITSSNRRMAVVVAGKVDSSISSPGKVRDQINKDFLPQLFKKYPTVSKQLTGNNLEDEKMKQEMKKDFILALIGVYVLLAIPLKSYIQPFLIMCVIPFGIVGAILGHGILGYPISMMSIFGIIAVTGVVVNDSLVMVSFVNDAVRDEGVSRSEAVMKAGQLRFRAIMLTTITTFFGVTPLIFSTSMQAANMIPMAISLGCGVLFATVVTLFLLPCIYIMLHDFKEKLLALRDRWRVSGQSVL